MYPLNSINYRSSQKELSEQLDALIIKLRSIEEIQQTSPELESYVHKLINIKHKVTVIYSVLQGAQVRWTFFQYFSMTHHTFLFVPLEQGRLSRIHKQIDREKIKKRSILDSELSSPATSSQSGQ